MKTFTPTDKLETLRVGDTLTLADSTVHEAVQDYTSCMLCSMYDNKCDGVMCIGYDFHFKLIKP